MQFIHDTAALQDKVESGKSIARQAKKNGKRKRNLIWNIIQVPSGKNSELPTDWVASVDLRFANLFRTELLQFLETDMIDKSCMHYAPHPYSVVVELNFGTVCNGGVF